jgi:hypothetical protein
MTSKHQIRTRIGSGVLFAALTAASGAEAAIVIHERNLNGFNAVAGNSQIVLTFDDLDAGRDITGTTIDNIQFLRGDNNLGTSAPLIIVNGSDTFTLSGFVEQNTNNPIENFPQYKLLPTTGAKILSPGGTELAPGQNNALENDSLTLVFINPVAGFGFDLLSQSADGDSYVFYKAFDVMDQPLSSGKIQISSALPNQKYSPSAPGGASFWGIVSDTANIKSIEINDLDFNSIWPDSNIGFDTFRFFFDLPVSPVSDSVSVPETSAVLGLGCLGAGALVSRVLRKRGE